MGWVIQSSRFVFGDDTVYPTKSAAMKVVRAYVKKEVRPLYRRVFRLYADADDPGDGYGWVYWDESKPARLWVEHEEEE